MDDTSGFYKKQGDDGYLYAHSYVINKGYELHRDQHEIYEYPVDGWAWFDSIDAATRALGFVVEEDPGEAR